MRRAVIVQQYVPGYRVAFYEHLSLELAHRDIELTVAHGSPWGKDVRRADACALAGTVQLPQRTFRLAGRHLVWRGLGPLAHECDALVLGQSLHSLENYPALLRRGGPPVGLWGHGGTYTRAHPAPLRAAKRALTLRARWFFAYTEQGAQHVIDQGFPEERVTTVRNAVDTRALAASRSRVSDTELSSMRSSYGLRPGRTALYVGGLDAAKRIPFLLAAAERVAHLLPGFRLLVAGDGAQRHLVEEVQRAGSPVVYVGTASDEEKARLGALADVLLVPGAVGLAAVDSFALDAPLVTTPRAAHGPEFEYLQHGRNALVVDGGLDSYAEAVTDLLTRSALLDRLRSACRTDAELYTVELMAQRFADGVEGLIHAGK
ncbi:glycosyltransferase family 4 protein [Streptomyces sp. V1I6]|uniref:glycosyltransferase family 4 protein n=1 Tax=Streptomyces sp. V1I6 TaxID=3042273 RepID=UPI002782E82B|nr:glycosyltransferase family 4 protein [Streptomyces sp. V1I6]MDQ0844818.1 glycosyltransferase involved in cell wall biosynthesis [Streptomyces sp. V1I6]